MNKEKKTTQGNYKKTHYGKITPEKVKEAGRLACLGLLKKDICALLEIRYETFNNWLRKGNEYLEAIEAGEEVDPFNEIYLDFKYSVERGEADLEEKLVNLISENIRANDDSHLALQFLRARFPHKYNRKAIDVQPGSEADERAKENPYASDFTKYLEKIGKEESEKDDLVDPDEIETDES